MEKSNLRPPKCRGFTKSCPAPHTDHQPKAQIRHDVCVCVCTRVLRHVRLCDPMDCRLLCPWGFQARTLEWAVIFYFMGSSQTRDRIYVSSTPHIGRRTLYA